MPSDDNDRPQVITFPPLILAATLLAGYVLDSFWPLALPFPGLTRRIGVPIVLLAFIIVGFAVREMVSKGTPLDVRKPTRRIVTSGIFQLSRNPIYLGMIVLTFGIALMAGSAWLLLLTPVFAAVLHYGVIAREESYLEGKFGADYLRYKARVRRWI